MCTTWSFLLSSESLPEDHVPLSPSGLCPLFSPQPGINLFLSCPLYSSQIPPLTPSVSFAAQPPHFSVCLLSSTWVLPCSSGFSLPPSTSVCSHLPLGLPTLVFPSHSCPHCLFLFLIIKCSDTPFSHLSLPWVNDLVAVSPCPPMLSGFYQVVYLFTCRSGLSAYLRVNVVKESSRYHHIQVEHAPFPFLPMATPDTKLFLPFCLCIAHSKACDFGNLDVLSATWLCSHSLITCLWTPISFSSAAPSSNSSAASIRQTSVPKADVYCVWLHTQPQFSPSSTEIMFLSTFSYASMHSTSA